MDPQNLDPSTPPAPPQEPSVQPPAPVYPQPPIEQQPAPTVQQPVEPMQPAPQPFQPPQPVVPPVTPIGGSASMPSSGRPGKGLLIGLIAGGVGLVVLIIIVVAAIAMMTVSKKDYLAALDQYNEVADKNYTLGSKVSSLEYDFSSGTDTSFDNDVDAAKKAIGDLKTENDQLGKLKAVKVGDGKKKYDAFNKKMESYTQFVDKFLTSLKDARGASTKCDGAHNNSTSNMKQIKAAIDDCVAALDKVSNTPDPDVEQFMSKLKDEYTSLSAIVAKLAAIKDPYGSQYSRYASLRDQMYKVVDNISNAETDFQSNLEKHVNAVDPKDSANDLGNFLEAKVSK